MGYLLLHTCECQGSCMTLGGALSSALCTVAIVALGPIGAASAADTASPPPETTLVNVRADRTPGSTGVRSQVNETGQFVTFASRDQRLVAGETISAGYQLYVRDRFARVNTLVSRSADGSPGDEPTKAYEGSMSTDGQLIAFTSTARLVPEDRQPGSRNVFLYDQRTGAIVLLDHDLSGEVPTGASSHPMISADGSTVAFTSTAADLVDGVAGGDSLAYTHDLATGSISLVSHRPDGTPVPVGAGVDISADGQQVAYVAMIGAGRRAAARSVVVVYDAATGHTRRVSQTPDGRTPNADSDWPSMSSDGDRIAYVSAATDIDGATGGLRQVFVYDRSANVTELVSRAQGGSPGNADQPPGPVWMSADGLAIGYTSNASNLVFGDTNGVSDVYRAELSLGLNELVSVDEFGMPLGAPSRGGSLSGDGRVVGFQSKAPNAVPGVNLLPGFNALVRSYP